MKKTETLNSGNKLLKQRLEEMLKVLADNVNKTEMEWFQLCSIASNLNNEQNNACTMVNKDEGMVNVDDENINKQPIDINDNSETIVVKTESKANIEEFDSD